MQKAFSLYLRTLSPSIRQKRQLSKFPLTRELSVKLTEGEIQSANGTKQLYKKGGLVTALSGNPCNWVPYG